jgi:hypothetical protein
VLLQQRQKSGSSGVALAAAETATATAVVGSRGIRCKYKVIWGVALGSNSIGGKQHCHWRPVVMAAVHRLQLLLQQSMPDSV